MHKTYYKVTCPRFPHGEQQIPGKELSNHFSFQAIEHPSLQLQLELEQQFESTLEMDNTDQPQKHALETENIWIQLQARVVFPQDLIFVSNPQNYAHSKPFAPPDEVDSKLEKIES